MRFEWKTSARQTLVVNVNSLGEISAELYGQSGDARHVPAIVHSHLMHWWKAEQLLLQLGAAADAQRGELRQSVTFRHVAEPQGIGLGYDLLRRNTQNLHSMHAIRDVALSRALTAADKAMMTDSAQEKTPTMIAGVILAPEALLSAAQATH